MQGSFYRSLLANDANCIFVHVPVREKILFSLTTNKGAFSASFNFVNFQVIKALQMLDEVILLLRFLA